MTLFSRFMVLVAGAVFALGLAACQQPQQDAAEVEVEEVEVVDPGDAADAAGDAASDAAGETTEEEAAVVEETVEETSDGVTETVEEVVEDVVGQLVLSGEAARVVAAQRGQEVS